MTPITHCSDCHHWLDEARNKKYSKCRECGEGWCHQCGEHRNSTQIAHHVKICYRIDRQLMHKKFTKDNEMAGGIGDFFLVNKETVKRWLIKYFMTEDEYKAQSAANRKIRSDARIKQRSEDRTLPPKNTRQKTCQFCTVRLVYAPSKIAGVCDWCAATLHTKSYTPRETIQRNRLKNSQTKGGDTRSSVNRTI